MGLRPWVSTAQRKNLPKMRTVASYQESTQTGYRQTEARPLKYSLTRVGRALSLIGMRTVLTLPESYACK